MTSIKPPLGPTTKIVQTQMEAPGKQTTLATQAAPSVLPSINPEAISDALKKYQLIRSKLKDPKFLKSASGLFADQVTFPPELLDPTDPANDPRYLHLMFALFGLKELERYFTTPEQLKEREEKEPEEKPGKKSKQEKK